VLQQMPSAFRRKRWRTGLIPCPSELQIVCSLLGLVGTYRICQQFLNRLAPMRGPYMPEPLRLNSSLSLFSFLVTPPGIRLRPQLGAAHAGRRVRLALLAGVGLSFRHARSVFGTVHGRHPEISSTQGERP
jgi:hypothetical protein